jgi:hypothetical protein
VFEGRDRLLPGINDVENEMNNTIRIAELTCVRSHNPKGVAFSSVQNLERSFQHSQFMITIRHQLTIKVAELGTCEKVCMV